MQTLSQKLITKHIREKSHSIWRKITFKKKARDAVIQAMIEVDVEEWGDFLLAYFFTMFCNVLIITAIIKTSSNTE